MQDPPRPERFVLYDQNGKPTFLRENDVLMELKKELNKGKSRFFCRVIRPPLSVLKVFDTESKTEEEGIPLEGPLTSLQFAEYVAELAKHAGFSTTPYKYARPDVPAIVLVPKREATAEESHEEHEE